MPCPLRVLLIDDNPDFLGFCVRLLAQEEGIEVVPLVVNGHRAFELALEMEVDIVVVDVSLRGQSGFELVRRLKEGPRPPMALMLSIEDAPFQRATAALAGAERSCRTSTAPASRPRGLASSPASSPTTIASGRGGRGGRSSASGAAPPPRRSTKH
jgi:DNA-binding NarL/FixJ family response regulator